jgi:hypothetical protein
MGCVCKGRHKGGVILHRICSVGGLFWVGVIREMLSALDIGEEGGLCFFVA